MSLKRLPTRTKIIYGSGDTGFSLTQTILGAYFAIFLTDVVGIPAGVAAIAVFVGRSWDYVNDPIIGHLSDRTRSRFGRRRPYFLFGAAPFAVTFCMLWWKPPLTGTTPLALYYAVAYLLFDTAATFVYMPYFALTPELTSDYDERTSLTSYRMFFSILASLIAFSLPLMIIGSFRPENAGRVLLMGAIFAVVSAAPLVLVFFGTSEPAAPSAVETSGFFESIKAVSKNRPFRYSLGLYLCTWVAIDIMQATLLYFLKYNMLRESESDLILATIFVAAILALPLWNRLSVRYAKKTAYIIGIVFWIVVQITIVSLGPGTPLAVLLALCVCAGIGVGAAHVLPWSMLPDAIEWDERETGTRREGIYYSAVTLTKKITSSIAIPLALLLLGVADYVPNAQTQSTQALLTIRLLAGPIPALLLVAGIVFAARYPLGREEFAAIVGEIERRRREESE